MTTTDLPARKQIRPIGNNLKPYAIERRLVHDPNSTLLIKHFTETLIIIVNETILKILPSNRRNTVCYFALIVKPIRL